MDDEGGPRTFGIWWLVALFVALTVAGTLVFIVVGSPSGPTVTLPASTAPAAVVSTTTPPGSATFDDGRPTPDGVSEVLVVDGTTSLSFTAPARVDLDSYEPVVPATAADAESDGISLRLTVACATSSDGFLAQITITETDDLVSVLAVSLDPPDGPPCAPDQRTEVVVQLASPLGARTLVVAPAGTAVPTG